MRFLQKTRQRPSALIPRRCWSEIWFTPPARLPLDPQTGQLVEGGIKEQTIRVLENLKAVLAEAGSDLRHVIKTTVFLKNMGDFAAMNEIYARYLAPEGVVAPARSTVEVARLPKDALVEIEVIAQR